MFNHKFFLFVLFIIFNSVFAAEINVEVKIDRNINNDAAEVNYLLKLKGMEEGLYQKINSSGLNLELFKSRVSDSKFSKDNYFSFLSAFFKSSDLILLAGINAQTESGSSINGIFRGDLNEAFFNEKFIEFTENLEIFKLKNVYLDFNIDLANSTYWEDLGTSSEELFSQNILSSWRNILLEVLKDFKNVLLVDDKVNLVLENSPKVLSNDSAIIKIKISVKKILEKVSINKVSFEITAHYILLNPKDRSILKSFDYPIQIKEFNNKNLKERSSTLATIIFNLLKNQTPSIVEALAIKKGNFSSVFSLKGQTLFSEIYKAQAALEKFLLKDAVKINIKKLSLTDSELLPQTTLNAQALQDRFKKMGKLPLSADSSEQKVLIFDSTNNSFAITQKD